jgi:hypothetical protein
MARTAPVPNIPPIPGMCPSIAVLAGGGDGGGGSGKGAGDGDVALGREGWALRREGDGFATDRSDELRYHFGCRKEVLPWIGGPC